jgi:phosphoribosylformimino-5-aminoimidazole carboxamide ribotide isomerase
MASKMVSAGVKRIIYTDIARDGTLTEPDFIMTGELVSFVDIPVIASGGVSSMEHLARLKNSGVEGVIIGKALYTGDINLAEAVTAVA